ncbi:hypothetical protein ABVN80_00640 [Acinetobacter baumannii]
MAISPEQLQALIQGLPLAKNRTAASGNNVSKPGSSILLFSKRSISLCIMTSRHTAVMNTLPDLSQLTHEQLLEFTRQLAMQHQSLAQSKQQLGTIKSAIRCQSSTS